MIEDADREKIDMAVDQIFVDDHASTDTFNVVMGYMKELVVKFPQRFRTCKARVYFATCILMSSLNIVYFELDPGQGKTLVNLLTAMFKILEEGEKVTYTVANEFLESVLKKHVQDYFPKLADMTIIQV